MKIYIKEFLFHYNQFLSLLLESKVQNINNLEKLNEIGYNLINLNKKLENLFIEIINSKTDNMEIIELYSEFVENIFKDEEKNKKCNELKQLLYNKFFEDINENDHSNFNLELLKGKISHYLIISTKKKKFRNNFGLFFKFM